MTAPGRTPALLLLGVGGAVTVAASLGTWARLSADDGLRSVSVAVTGSSLAPLATAAGVVALTAVLAVVSVRGWLRRAVGVVVAVLTALALAQVGLVLVDLTGRARSWWSVEVAALASSAQVDTSPLLAAATGLGLALATAGAVVVVLRGSSWAGLSARYERSGHRVDRSATTAGSTAGSSADVWQALDRGDDPTSPDDPTLPTDPTSPADLTSPDDPTSPDGQTP